jgi:hypothetical protein
VSSKGKFLKGVSFLALLLFVAGCGGFRAQRSVSLLDFLLPGAGGILKADPPPADLDPLRSAPAATQVKQIA